MLGHEGRQGLVGDAVALLIEVLGDLLVELPRRLVAIVDVADQGLTHDADRLGRQRALVLLEHVEAHVHDLVQGLEVTGPEEEPTSEQQLGEHDARGEDVRAVVDVEPGDLLRRHVAELALEHAGLGLGLLLHQGDAEVADLHVTAK